MLLGYLGHVYFEGIDLCVGKIHRLENRGRIINNRRWATAIVDNNKISLFCSKSIADLWRVQEILRYESNDGINFKEVEKIADGGCQFIWQYLGRYYLYFHRRSNERHHILVKSSPSIEGLKDADEILLLDSSDTLSAPSMAHIGDFWLTCEWRHNGRWYTVAYKADSPLGPFARLPQPLFSERACALQHIFENHYIITYSKQTGNRWDLRVRWTLI